MNTIKPLVVAISCSLVLMPTGSASIQITNGNFEDSAPPGDTGNVLGWFDANPAQFWTACWLKNGGDSPNGTVITAMSAVAATGAIDGAGTESYVYQGIGTADGATSVTISFQWGSFSGAPTRDMGITAAIYKSDGTFVAADGTDLQGATGVTLLDQETLLRTGVAGGALFTESFTFDISGAGADQLYLRINNYDAAGKDEAWVSLDNINLPPAQPVFLSQPNSYTGSVGDNVTLIAGASSDPAPTYQWQASETGEDPWTNLPSQTAATLSFNPAAYSDNGFYRVIATNPGGSVTSDIAQVLLVYPAPTITQQPQPGAVVVGSNVELSVAATGIGNLSYQWYKDDIGGAIPLTDGGRISGATSANLQISIVEAGDEGDYYVIVSDDAAVADQGSPTESTSATVAVTLVEQLVTLGTAPPAVGDGVQNLNFSTDDASNTQHQFVPSDYMGSQYRGDNLQMGQSFTTGSDAGYLLKSISVRQVSWGPTDWDYDGGSITLRIFDLTAAGPGPVWNATQLASEISAIPAATAPTIGGTPTAPVWLTFELSDPVSLNPNSLYAFSISSTGGSANGSFFMNLDGTATNSYSAGFSISVPDNESALWDGGNGQPSDRAFVANMESTGPGNTYSAWIGGFYPSETDPQIVGLEADPDHDGLPNGVENYFGTNPTTPSTGIKQVTKTGDTVTFQHSQNPTPATDVSASYRWSADLASWNGSGVANGDTTVTFTTSPDTPTAGTTTVTATISGTVPTKLFSQLSVQSP